MSETPTPAAIAEANVTEAQVSYLAALNDEARLDRALEKARADLANIEHARSMATAEIRRLRAELHTALVAELEAAELAESAEPLETVPEASA